MDSNRFLSISKLHMNEKLLLFSRWAPLFLGTCCNTLNASACTNYRYEMVTETSVRCEERGNVVQFRKWHDSRLQEKEQRRPGENFIVFPLSNIFTYITAMPGISKNTSIASEVKPESQWLKWYIGQMPFPATAHLCSSLFPLEWLNLEQLHWPYF